jgi:hypothetical protein
MSILALEILECQDRTNIVTLKQKSRANSFFLSRRRKRWAISARGGVKPTAGEKRLQAQPRFTISSRW